MNSVVAHWKQSDLFVQPTTFSLQKIFQSYKACKTFQIKLKNTFSHCNDCSFM